MTVDRMEMNGMAAFVFVLLLAAVAAAVIGDAVQRVVDARRRWAQRERELTVLERYHGRPDRPPAAGPADQTGGPGQ